MDAIVNADPIARFSAIETCSPKNGNTRICVSTATPNPTTTLVTASVIDMSRLCFMPLDLDIIEAQPIAVELGRPPGAGLNAR